MGEVSQTVSAKVAEVARRLAPDPCPRSDWQALCVGVMDAAGNLYADAHYAEMDRLLDMTEAERAEYVEAEGGQIPLAPVWDAFDLRMSMLTALADAIEIPAASEVAAPGRTG